MVKEEVILLKINMKEWLKTAAAQKKPMPILGFPGVQLIGDTVRTLTESGEKQATCIKAIADRYDMLAALSLMDLSVEAEAFGAPIHQSDDEVPTVTGAVAGDEEAAEALQIPAVGAGRTGECIRGIEMAAQTITDRPVLAGMIGPFSLAGRLMDMTEIMVMCYTDPDVVHTVLKKATDFLSAYGQALKDAGANGMVMAEPAAGLLSPALNNEFSVPYVKKITSALEDDWFTVVYHNCGNTLPLLDGICSIGAKVLHFGDAVDLREILPRIPADTLVMGNISPAMVLRNGTPEDVRTATRQLLQDCAEYPNFILSSGCDLPPNTPLANIDAFFETAAAFYAEK